MDTTAITKLPSFKVFILEDSPERVQSFRDRFNSPDSGITAVISVTDDVEEGRRLLRETAFDLVLLDHDLADVETKPGELIARPTPKAEDGYALAHWLAMNPNIARRHGSYMTHSLNKPGRDRITGAFRSLGIPCAEAPFLWTEPIFKKHVVFPATGNVAKQLVYLKEELRMFEELITQVERHSEPQGDYLLKRKLCDVVEIIRAANMSLEGAVEYMREKT